MRRSLALGAVVVGLVACTGYAQQASNRLATEKSPYLLQHVTNPVDWYPWGEEAFAAASREQKPIFLSIGYSTCHWCHVMERESFSNAELAKVLNQDFIAIKVDREERPDIDAIYMAFVQATTGRGGWPLNVFLTPERRPFFGGTYFPPEARTGMPSFADVLGRVAQEWKDNRARILDAAVRIEEALKRDAIAEPSEGLPGATVQKAAYDWFRSSYDREKGGFGQAPKFPRPAIFSFLLRQTDPARQQDARHMVASTLSQMARGGIHDHLGGGFHRYSTDADWFLPHFEKMLYDQAQLVVAYLEAYQVSGDQALAETARSILDYVLRDLAHSEGAFYSAEDADSPLDADHPEEQAEGAFYVWTQDELQAVLGDVAPLFLKAYGARPDGNVGRDPFKEFGGKNVLWRQIPDSQLARERGVSATEIGARLQEARVRLLKVRNTRPRPLRDDKILTGWNGLMLTALSRAAQVLGDSRYRDEAIKTAVFLKQRMWDAQRGRLLRRYRLGEAGIDGFLEDYTLTVQGLLDLYETTVDDRWLLWALELAEVQERIFGDLAGGYFTAGAGDASLLMRMKDTYDGALPAANSIALSNLVRLGQMTGAPRWVMRATQGFRAFGAGLESTPHASPLMLTALAFQQHSPRQVLLAGDRNAADTVALLREVHQRFDAHRVILLADGGAWQRKVVGDLPVLASLSRIDGKATAYVCRNYVCDLPTNDPAELADLLDGRKP